MTFTHPWVLLLLVVPVALAWTVVSRGAGLVMPLDHQSEANAGGRRQRALGWLLGAFDAVPLLVLAGAILIIAGPQILKQPKRERLLTNIQICMDVSGSMSGRNYQIASQAIEDFTRAREGDAFGLTLFGVAQIRWLPLTKDLQVMRNAMPFANPDNQPRHMSGTAIAAALRFCKSNMEIEATEGDRLIVLVSDGFSSDLGNGEEYEVVDELKAAGITLYHIHVDQSDIPSEVVELARGTGGDGFHASDAASLRTVFAHIDRMKPARYASVGTVPMDHFRPFAIAVLALLGLHGIGLMGVRYTPW